MIQMSYSQIGLQKVKGSSREKKRGLMDERDWEVAL